MKQFISFVIKEARHILRDKRTMLILFGMPVVLMLLFGFAITTDVKNVRTVVVTASMDHLTRQAVERLSASEYFNIVATVGTPREAEQMIRRQKADLAIVFGNNFASALNSLTAGGKVRKGGGVQMMVDGADPNMAQQWTVYAQSILSQSVGGNHQAMSSPFANILGVRLLYNPQMRSAYNFVPAIVREKERGTMEVLLVSPVKPLMVIVAKAVPYLILAICILVTILLMARFVLDVPLQGSLVWILLVSMIYILLALSLGLLISNIAQTQLVALLLSAMVLLMPVVMLSGMLFPVESMPVVLQWVSALVPPRYYIEAMRKLMIMGVGIGEVAKEVTVLVAMTVFFLAVSLAKFNKRLE